MKKTLQILMVARFPNSSGERKLGPELKKKTELLVILLKDVLSRFGNR